MPGLSNVKVKLCPGARSPEPHVPLSPVTVWVTESLFVHLTDWPAFTVIVWGAKAKLAMVTDEVDWPVEFAGAIGVVELPELAGVAELAGAPEFIGMALDIPGCTTSLRGA